MGLIYQALNKTNGKSYVGQTKFSLEKRKTEHKYYSNSYHNHFSKALRKYGWKSFKWSVLENNINPKDLNEKEVYWIKKLDTFKNGYNSTSGGGQGVELSEEHKRKIGFANKGNKLSEETIKRRTESRKGYRPSKKTIAKQVDKISQLWEIIDPKGITFMIKNLSKFCRENNLNNGCMAKVASVKEGRRQHKGWKCKKLGKNPSINVLERMLH